MNKKYLAILLDSWGQEDSADEAVRNARRAVHIPRGQKVETVLYRFDPTRTRCAAIFRHDPPKLEGRAPERSIDGGVTWKVTK